MLNTNKVLVVVLNFVAFIHLHGILHTRFFMAGEAFGQLYFCLKVFLNSKWLAENAVV